MEDCFNEVPELEKIEEDNVEGGREAMNPKKEDGRMVCCLVSGTNINDFFFFFFEFCCKFLVGLIQNFMGRNLEEVGTWDRWKNQR